MSWNRLQTPVVLMIGMILGLGVATYRAHFPGQFSFAGEPGTKEAAKGIFSPPGTSESGTVVPPPNPPVFKGKVGPTINESTPDWPPLARAPKGAPNVLYIVLDDVGYAAIGCYGSPVVKTPHLDKLAKNGVRYNNFHTTALCSPSRSCLLTGRNHHSNAMACITEGSTGFPGSYGRIPLANGFLSEMLTPFGWAAFAIGKWHLTPAEDMNLACNRKWWPLGRGFDRFYGFLGGEVDQYTPWLTYDNHFIKPPKTPEQGYHNVVDLTDKAKEFIADLKQVAPDRPFFMYYCPGACHAPHHAPMDWIEKYKGAFDAGWDDYREKALAKQIQLGICPPGTKLSPRDPDVQEWNTLTDQEKTMYAHQMEVYAAYLSFVDHYIGELVAFLESMDQLDNTMIIVVSDNGASAEGGPTGSFNENLFFNGRPDTVQQNLKHLAKWGGPSTYPHYSWGWAHATNTPFRRWKREVARGGTSDLCIVHWPKGIKAKDAIRHQFVHAIDLVPTVLDVLKLNCPTSINGVTQSPIEGVSFVPTFDEARAKISREAQYFEMFAQRAIYLDGWRAYAPWKFGDNITAKDLTSDKWMLFNIDADFSESQDLAKKNPEKLEELSNFGGRWRASTRYCRWTAGASSGWRRRVRRCRRLATSTPTSREPAKSKAPTPPTFATGRIASSRTWTCPKGEPKGSCSRTVRVSAASPSSSTKIGNCSSRTTISASRNTRSFRSRRRLRESTSCDGTSRSLGLRTSPRAWGRRAPANSSLTTNRSGRASSNEPAPLHTDFRATASRVAVIR